MNNLTFWDTTTQYSHLLGQFCDYFRLLKIMIFMNFVGGLRKLNSIQNVFFDVLEPQGHPKVILDRFGVIHFFIIFVKEITPKCHQNFELCRKLPRIHRFKV